MESLMCTSMTLLFYLINNLVCESFGPVGYLRNAPSLSVRCLSCVMRRKGDGLN